MMGVFVQVNEDTRQGRWVDHLIGYIICENGCWEWVGAKGDNGYGFWYRHKKQRQAHRVMYEQTKGPIPKGLQLDHLCRNRGCVNPAHLEVVTARENTLRGAGVAAKNHRKTHCPKGHEYSPENTRTPLNGGKRYRGCRTCEAARDARRTLERRSRKAVLLKTKATEAK